MERERGKERDTKKERNTKEFFLKISFTQREKKEIQGEKEKEQRMYNNKMRKKAIEKSKKGIAFKNNKIKQQNRQKLIVIER